MKTNAELQRDVQEAIKWEPLLHAAEIGVIVSDGIVTLTGTVDSYAKKMEAERAAKKVAGVKAIAENIDVKFPSSFSKTDAEVAEEVVGALKAAYNVPDDRVKVQVEDGWVTLEGDVPWYYQKEAAESAVKYLTGVKNVKNNIQVKSKLHDALEKKNIQRALNRSAINDENIEVEVSGTTVTLDGTVDSWYQREEAGRIAWKTPGVQNVKNNLVVDYSYAY